MSRFIRVFFLFCFVFSFYEALCLFQRITEAEQLCHEIGIRFFVGVVGVVGVWRGLAPFSRNGTPECGAWRMRATSFVSIAKAVRPSALFSSLGTGRARVSSKSLGRDAKRMPGARPIQIFCDTRAHKSL